MAGDPRGSVTIAICRDRQVGGVDTTNDDPDVEEAVGEAFASLQEAYPDRDLGPASVGALADLLERASEPDLRRDAARLLAMLAERYPGAVAPHVDALVEGLDEAEDDVGRHLLLAVGHVSTDRPTSVEPAVDRLVGVLDEDPRVARHAAWSLANVADASPGAVAPAAPALVDCLEAEDEDVRRHAAQAVGRVAEAAPDAVKPALGPLLDLLESRSLYRSAGRALAGAAPVFGEPAVDGLIEGLEPGNPERREHAAWTLAQVAEADPSLVATRWPGLVELLREDEDHQVQNGVAAALAAVASDDPTPDLVGALVDLLDHPDAVVRRYGCLALGDVAMATRDGAVLAALEDAREDPMPLVAEQAARHLADVAAEHPDAVAEVAPDVVEAVRDEP